MGQQQSKDELLYQQVSYGNIDGIKSLRSEGAGLEYLDREGKTPLALACLNPALYNVAKTLIELGANVNAYRPGRNGGTPLHHAAKRGLENTVKLLLLHGANALMVNDDCQTPLEVARAKGYSNVVRAIENHICLYSGWLRELYGPGFLELLAPQLISRKVWVVVLPCGSRNLRKPFKLELAIYTNIQDAQPRTSIALWRANMEEPDFNQPDPAVTISEASAIPRRRRRRSCRPRHVSQERIKLAPLNESDKQQLQQFCSACKGIPQVMHANFPFNTPTPVAPITAPPAAAEASPIAADTSPDPKEDLELAMAINASLQSAMEEGIPLDHAHASSEASSSTAIHSVPLNGQVDPTSNKGSCSEQFVEEGGPSGTSAISSSNTPTPMPIPSAPTLTDEVLPDGPIHYPTIDPNMFEKDYTTEDGSKRAGSSSCVICFDAPVEGACVPCGHMAGCMSCLNEIKAKKWGCPVCRTNIDQVIKVYAV
ncbi:putative E3 ubiquitin-protein ligase XBAT35 isoform X1 [Chenopodium quinoa]|uniref:RING-type domain-containing protein n=1 Tax=Chenopodium quinoa TaxID=63459 RepID=A0A803LMQ1_CHEQI|nr:putative E3 ubiquitin-protein ligase XBAT35 isoform X1 [Chenopodium quinoa]